METPIVEITAIEAAVRRQQDGVLLLDCREPEELQLARIDGAKHVPMGDIPVRLPELDPEREWIIFCHHGVRSRSVAAWLAAQGYERVSSMRGGIHAWARDVDPSVSTY